MTPPAWLKLNSSPLAILNALLLFVWVVALASWVVVENRRYDVMAGGQRAQQQAKAADVLARAQEETLAITNLLRSNRLIIEGLLVQDHNKLLDTTLPMMQLPHVQLLTLYRANGEVAVQAHQSAVFGRPNELSAWLASGLSARQQVNTTVARVDQRLYLLSAGRVEDLNGLGGYVVVGSLLDKTFADKLSLATGVRAELRFGPGVADRSPGAPERQSIVLPANLAAAGLAIELVNPASELRQAWQQNLTLGVTSLVVAGLFMLAVAAVSSRAVAKSQAKLLRARDQADAAHQASRELLAREEEQRRRLDLLVRCSNVGSFEWDAQTQQAEYSPRLKEMLGRAPDADTRDWQVAQLIHPDDRKDAMSRSFALMRASAAAGTVSHTQSHDFRLLRPDGQVVWVHGDAIAVAGSDGTTQKFLASFIDMTPILAAEEDTRAALKRQQELNALRSRFISMTSHEFRTPLATILSSAQLLKYYNDRLSAPEKEEVIGNIEAGVARMAHMMDKVLSIGKAEAKMQDFLPERINLQATCQTLLAQARLHRPDSRCRLVADFDIDPAEGIYDETLLHHMFDNLLSNAVKYSPEGGEVRFAVRREGVRMVFEVSDQGIGIPTQEIPDLFGSFHRASNVGDIPGTGLGLAIVKNAVELHGGEIQVRSQPGQGTCFTVRI